MKTKKIIFPEAHKAVLQEQDIDIEAKKPNDIFLKTMYSVVSAGTEGALYKGTESWAQFPVSPGYGAIGKVISAGENMQSFKTGDTVFTYGNHSSYVKGKRMIIKVPEDIDPREAVIARMAQVSFTSLRTSAAVLGDYVAVIGQGLVGNIAAQLFVNSGCTVIAIDVIKRRLELSKKCGVDHTVYAAENDVVEAVKEITRGKMCTTVVEASGIPNQALTASMLAAKKGEVILLGSPRGEFTADAMTLLNNIHLWSNGCITFKGGHEWRYPDKVSAQGDYKISLEGNLQNYFSLLQKSKLVIDPLITHIAKPEDCGNIYTQLNEKNEDFLGVLFEWE